MIELSTVASFEPVAGSHDSLPLRSDARPSADFAQILASRSQAEEQSTAQVQPVHHAAGEAPDAPEGKAEPVDHDGQMPQQESRPADPPAGEVSGEVSLAHLNATELTHQTPVEGADLTQSPQARPTPQGEKSPTAGTTRSGRTRAPGPQSGLPAPETVEPPEGESSPLPVNHEPAPTNKPHAEGAPAVHPHGEVQPMPAASTAHGVGEHPVDAAMVPVSVKGAAAPANSAKVTQADFAARPAEAHATAGFREVMSRLGARSGSPFVMRSEEATAAQAARIVAQGLRDGKTEVVLRLRPETLGPVKIELSVNENALSARIEASTPAARELLEASVEHLRTALQARGLVVQELNVAYMAGLNDAGIADHGSGQEDRTGNRQESHGREGAGRGGQERRWGEETEAGPGVAAAGVDIERSDMGVIRIDAIV